MTEVQLLEAETESAIHQKHWNFEQVHRDRLIERLGLKPRETKLLQALDRIAQMRGIADEFGNLHVDVPKSEVAMVMDASVDTAKRAWLSAERTPYLLVEKSNNAAHYFTLQWPIIFDHSSGRAAPPFLAEIGGAAGGAALQKRGGSFSGRGGSSCTPLNRKNPMFQGGGSTPYGGEGELNSSSPQGEGWQLATSRLRDCKVSASKSAIESAMDRGWSPDQVIVLCDQFQQMSIDGVFAWTNRQLYGHLKNADPGSVMGFNFSKEYSAKLADRTRRKQEESLLQDSGRVLQNTLAQPSLEGTWGELLDSLNPEELQELIEQCPPMVRTRYRTNGLSRAIRGPLLAALAKQFEDATPTFSME